MSLDKQYNLNEFNNTYGIPGGTPFKGWELLCMLLETFKDVSLNLYPECELNTGQKIPKQFGIGIEEMWGSYQFSTKVESTHSTSQALSQLLQVCFLQNKDNEKFQQIVKKVYRYVTDVK